MAVTLNTIYNNGNNNVIMHINESNDDIIMVMKMAS